MTADVTVCPKCGERKLRVEWRFEIARTGTFSVSRRVPWLVCWSCGVEVKGVQM